MFKALALRLLAKLIVSREDMIGGEKLVKRNLRKSYEFNPQYTPTLNNDIRFDELPVSIYVDPFYLFEVDQVSLIGPYGLPVTRYGRILQETSQGSVIKCVFRTVSLLGFVEFIKLYISVFFPRSKMDLECAFHLVPRHGYGPNQPNYSHWILENLPQLFALDSIADQSPKIVVNQTMTKWQRESLCSMGLDLNSIVPLSKSIIHVRKLYLSSMRSATSSNSERDPRGRSWAMNRLKSAGTDDYKVVKRKHTFLSRQDLARGFITNMKALEVLLDKYDFEIYHPGQVSFQHDVDYFRDVGLLVAPHGASMANMVFSDSCNVIEIVCGPKWDTDLFYFTALECGFTYDTAICKRDYEYEDNNSEIEEAWIVDIPGLEKNIEVALSLMVEE